MKATQRILALILALLCTVAALPAAAEENLLSQPEIILTADDTAAAAENPSVPENAAEELPQETAAVQTEVFDEALPDASELPEETPIEETPIEKIPSESIEPTMEPSSEPSAEVMPETTPEPSVEPSSEASEESSPEPSADPNAAPAVEDIRYFNIEDGVVTHYGGDSSYVVVPDGVIAIGRDAFRYNRDIQTVILPEGCTRIESGAFYASYLQEIDLPDSLEYIGEEAFEDSQLRSIQLPAGLKTIGNEAFRDTYLEAVKLPEGLESIGYNAFAYTKIKKLRLPGSLGIVENNAAPHAEEIEFGEGITEVNFTIASAYSDTSIRKITFPTTIRHISARFFEESSYADGVSIYGPAGSVAETYFAGHRDAYKFTFYPLDSIHEDENFRIENGVLAAYKGSSAEVPVPENVTSIGENAFKGLTHVRSVRLPEGLTRIGDGAFRDCTGLQEIQLPASLLEIGEYAFRDCAALQEIQLPDGLQQIKNYAFTGCSSLKSVTLPGSLNFTGVDCFKNCTGLESVTYLKGYTHVGGFDGCANLRNVTIPEGVTSIGENAFRNCTSLKGIVLPESLNSIGSHAFTGTAIETIVLPDGLDYISFRAFENCSSLTSISLPKELNYIDSEVFKDCASLRSVYIPNGPDSIRMEAFMNCTSLKSVYVPASVKEIEENVFLNCPNLTVITPSGSSMEKYCKENGIPCAKPDSSAKSLSFPEGDLILGVGQSYTLRCEADSDYALGTVSFSSSSPAVAVDKVTGELTAKKAGSATITARAESGAKASCKVRVLKAPSSVEFAEEEIILGFGESMQLSCILPKNTAAGLTFEGSNFFALHVEPDGRITAVGEGSDTVTVTTHNGKSASCSVTVLPPPASVILPEREISIPQSLSFRLEPAVNEGSLCRSFSYESSDPSIAGVDADGRVTAHAMGKAEIKVYVTALPEVFAICSVTVSDPPPRILLSAGELTLGVKESFDLKPRYDGDFSGSFTCASSNEKVAAVDANGVVTAKKTGTAIITVTGENGLSTACTVTVKKAHSSIKLTKSKLEMGAGERLQLEWTLSKNTAGSISFESSNPEIAELSPEGVVTAKAPGTATIQAVTFNGRKSTAKLTVYPAPESISIERDGAPLRLGVGESGILGVKLSAGSCGAYRFESSNSDIVEINSNGKFRAKMLGECTLTVTAYNGLSESRAVQVCMPPVKVEFDEFNANTIGVGQQYRLSVFCPAEGNVPCGPGLSFKSSNARVASVDANGVVTGLKTGTVTITATSFNGKKDSWRMSVKKAPTQLKLNAEELYMGYCETFPLEAVLSPSGSWGNVQFSISDESAAWFDEGLLVANRSRGSVTVTATTYNGLSASCTVHFGPEPSYVKFAQEEIRLCVGMKTPLEFDSDGSFTGYSIESSDKRVAYVDDDGMIVAKKKGTATITLTTYNQITASMLVRVEAAPKKLSLNLPLPLRTGASYNLCAYLSSDPSYDPMLLIKSVSLSNRKASVSHDANGWYLLPKEAGSITLTIKTLGATLRLKTSIVAAPDSSLPDIYSPVNTEATQADFKGTWKLACLGSQKDGLAFTPEQMGVTPYIINIREADADIISDDNSLFDFPIFMDGSTLILDTIGNKIPAQMHQNGCLTLPQKTEGVHLWFVRQ